MSINKCFGLPYMGSKNKLAERIVDLLPSATHLYDVFCGGGAITHCALLSGKFGCVHFSDITNSVELLRDCFEGNIPDGSEWISREEFYARKDSDPYVRLLWSFGNNQRNYLYSKEIEPYKRAVHEMIYGATPTERRLKFREVCRMLPFFLAGGEKNGGPRINGTFTKAAYRLQHAEAQLPPPKKLQNLQHEEAYQRLQNLSRAVTGYSQTKEEAVCRPFADGYEMRVCDYRDVEILPDSIIYADIPYRDTAGYGKTERKNDFGYDSFYLWAENQEAPVFISEYWMPEDRFLCIAEFDRMSTLSATNNSMRVVEKVFLPNKWKEWWEKHKKPELPKQLNIFDYED